MTNDVQTEGSTLAVVIKWLAILLYSAMMLYMLAVMVLMPTGIFGCISIYTLIVAMLVPVFVSGMIGGLIAYGLARRLSDDAGTAGTFAALCLILAPVFGLLMMYFDTLLAEEGRGTSMPFAGLIVAGILIAPLVTLLIRGFLVIMRAPGSAGAGSQWSLLSRNVLLPGLGIVAVIWIYAILPNALAKKDRSEPFPRKPDFGQVEKYSRVAFPPISSLANSLGMTSGDKRALFAVVDIERWDIDTFINIQMPDPKISQRDRLGVTRTAFEKLHPPRWWNPDSVKRFTAAEFPKWPDGSRTAMLIDLDDPARAHVYLVWWGTDSGS
jgi:hypothetical protein